MKTNITKISGRYVAPTGNICIIDYIRIGEDEYDELLSEEVVDVCTGEKFGKEFDQLASELSGETIYRLIKSYGSANLIKNPQHHNAKKRARIARIEAMVGVHWDKNGMKKVGKNRFLRRRMVSNAEQQKNFESYLPF